MAAPSPPAGLLDRAGRIFAQAADLARAFAAECDTQGRGLRAVDPTAWVRHRPAFETFCDALLELRDEMVAPPTGYEPLAKALMEAARVAKQIRDVMQTSYGQTWQSFLDFRFHLNSAVASGVEAIRGMNATQRAVDPFAFVEQAPAKRAEEIDTTPTVPRPPAAHIESAGRAIPVVLADVPPDHSGAIRLVAAVLVKRLQDAGHPLVAAHWAIHEAVITNRLVPGRVEVCLPMVIVPQGRTLPERLFDSHARNTASASTNTSGRGTKPIPTGKPAPFDCFTVTATESLWAWWRSLEVEDQGGAETTVKPPAEQAAPRVTGVKRSSERGEGRAKLTAALTAHHRYRNGGCENPTPIGNNELAKLAEVEKSTASKFFQDEFGGHAKYRTLCLRDPGGLLLVLKKLNDDLPGTELLYGSTSD